MAEGRKGKTLLNAEYVMATEESTAMLSARVQAENLINRLKEPEFRSMRVFTMTRNPLLLVNLCLVHPGRVVCGTSWPISDLTI